MIQKIADLLQNVPGQMGREALRLILGAVGGPLRNQMQVTAGLVIKTSSSALAKTGASACYGFANGKPFTIAAGTDMPALSGTVTNEMYNVYVFSQDEYGNRYSAMGKEAATLAGVKFPELPANRAVIGYIFVHPSASPDFNFVGGTTALDVTGGNVVYVSPIGAFDPTVLQG